MQERESKNESQFYITRKIFITQFIVIKTTVILFYDFHWQDFGFLGFLGKITCQDLGKKSKKSKILAKNEKIQDLGVKTKTPSPENLFNRHLKNCRFYYRCSELSSQGINPLTNFIQY